MRLNVLHLRSNLVINIGSMLMFLKVSWLHALRIQLVQLLEPNTPCLRVQIPTED